MAPDDNVELARLQDHETATVRAVIAEARAPATRRAYAADVRVFVAWCDDRRVDPLPATTATVLGYLVSMLDRGRRLSTINRAIVSIGLAHSLHGHDDPRKNVEVREFLKGLRRRMSDSPKTEASPLLLQGLRAAVNSCGVDTRIGLRNRALLVVGWFGALRRSEIAALDIGDLRIDTEGVVVRIRSSKTDQEGQGATIGLPARRDELCPVKVLRAWLALRDNPTTSAVFVALDHRCAGRRLSSAAVGDVVRSTAVSAELPEAQRFSGHSLRAGFATQAARNGKPAHAIRRQTRHRSIQQLERYIREGEVFINNAAAGL